MHTWHGIVAGFTATVVLSALMLMKSAMGLMPEVNAIQMLSRMAATYGGLPQNPVIGWLLHFFIGTILWGILFALVVPRLPGGYWLRGVVFATGAWLLMMIVAMPMAGAGLFGLTLGIGAPIATLVLHLVFGAVLGAVYGWLQSERNAPAGQRA